MADGGWLEAGGGWLGRGWGGAASRARGWPTWVAKIFIKHVAGRLIFVIFSDWLPVVWRTSLLGLDVKVEIVPPPHLVHVLLTP